MINKITQDFNVVVVVCWHDLLLLLLHESSFLSFLILTDCSMINEITQNFNAVVVVCWHVLLLLLLHESS